MIEKTIAYENFNGVKKTRKCLFHLNTAEISNWLATEGDYTLADRLEVIMEQRNGLETIKVFEDLIARSYGEKSLDGEQFVKNDEVRNGFIQSAAYPVLFNELLSDTSKAVEFFVGILPKDFSDEVEKIMKNMTEESPAQLSLVSEG